MRKIANPGNPVNHQASRKYCRPSAGKARNMSVRYIGTLSIAPNYPAIMLLHNIP